MYGPTKLAYALRPRAAAALIAAAIAVTLMFAATPFLIPEVSARYGVSNGTAAFISITQVGSFALANLVLPKLRLDRRLVFRTAAITFAATNLASALVGQFVILLVLRSLAGFAAGAMIWLVWNDAMTNPRSMSSIAATGPVGALVGSPIIALAAIQGDRAIYLLLTAAAIGVIVWPVPMVPGRTAMRRRVSGSRSNRVLLGALMLLSLSGASLFIFEAVAAREVLGLSAQAASIAFSLNAAGGLLGAHLSTRHRRPGIWLATCGIAAWATIGTGSAFLYFLGMTWWGFAFWMGVPGVMQMLAERSLEPGERAGDAQAYMAIGRTVAPLIGGTFIDAGAFHGLAIVSAIGLSGAGLAVVAVQEGRSHLPPTSPLSQPAPLPG